MKEVKTKVNTTLTLECQCWAAPPPAISWYKDGRVSGWTGQALTGSHWFCLESSRKESRKHQPQSWPGHVHLCALLTPIPAGPVRERQTLRCSPVSSSSSS